MSQVDQFKSLPCLAFSIVCPHARTDSSLDPIQDAWDCFWQGQCWQGILEWCDRYPHREESQWKPIADFMAKIDSKREIRDILSSLNLFTQLLDSVFPDITSLADKRRDETWKAVFMGYSQEIEKVSKASLLSEVQTTNWKTWEKNLSLLATTGFTPHENLAMAAHCAYGDSRYQDAIAFWEKCPQKPYRQQREYFLAQAKITLLPGKIPWLSRAEAFQTIVN